MESEKGLIEKAQSGDDGAFEALVRSYTGIVFSFAYRYAGNRDLAEDAAQETFLKAWKSLRRFDPDKPLKPWLLAIARNVVLDHLRKRAPVAFSTLQGNDDEPSLESTLPDPEPLPDEIFRRLALGEEVRRAVAELIPRDRAVLALRYEEGLPFEAIAEIMRAPLNTIKSWHRRALARLRPKLDPEGGAPKRHD
jgi:RNA polymerase sigma-70 factor (ECF subfamily)